MQRLHALRTTPTATPKRRSSIRRTSQLKLRSHSKPSNLTSTPSMRMPSLYSTNRRLPSTWRLHASAGSVQPFPSSMQYRPNQAASNITLFNNKHTPQSYLAYDGFTQDSRPSRAVKKNRMMTRMKMRGHFSLLKNLLMHPPVSPEQAVNCEIRVVRNADLPSQDQRASTAPRCRASQVQRPPTAPRYRASQVQRPSTAPRCRAECWCVRRRD